jgi:intracellular multiplication protein IcmO
MYKRIFQRSKEAGNQPNQDWLVGDTRSTSAKTMEMILDGHCFAPAMALLAAAAWLAPVLGIPVGLAAAWLAAVKVFQAAAHPLKAPIQANRPGRPFPDTHEIDLCNGRPKPASGIFYLGYDRWTGKEVWLTNDDVRQHFLVLGTCGAGKTETLVGFGANALNWSSGFMMVDGKGDVAVFAKIYALARRYGREDDLLVLNLLSPNSDVSTNAMNPFATGTADSLTRLVESLADWGHGEGSWRGRAVALLTVVMRALVDLRDEGRIELDAGVVRDHLRLAKVIELADQQATPDLAPEVRKIVVNWLSSLPGYKPGGVDAQSETTLGQHAYPESFFVKPLELLSDVYKHAFSRRQEDIDMVDVFLNRRILFVMLPALEMCDDRVSILGKTVVASLKRAMGFTLGDRIDSAYDNKFFKQSSNSNSPFMAIFDEASYYMVEGMDLMASQARSHGLSITYTAQDINGMKGLNDKIIGSIIGNTKTKVIMRIEDPETAKMAVEICGKAYRSTIHPTYDTAKIIMRIEDPETAKATIDAAIGAAKAASGPDHDNLRYSDDLEARIEEVERIKFLDMKNQDSGQMHVVYKDTIVKAQGFYANTEGSLDRYKLQMRANEFITVRKATKDDVARWITFETEAVRHRLTASQH